MTRDELLVHNGIAHVLTCLADKECERKLAPFLAAFEHDREAREAFMRIVCSSTDAGEQLTYTVVGSLQ